MSHVTTFSRNNLTVSQVFIHLEKYYKTNNKAPIKLVGLEIFFSRILHSSLISNYGNNSCVDISDYINKTCVDIIRNDTFAGLGPLSHHTSYSSAMSEQDNAELSSSDKFLQDEKMRSQRNLVKSYMIMIHSLSMEGIPLYLAEFKTVLLTSSRTYFMANSAELYNSLDSLSYLRHVQHILAMEALRSEVYSLKGIESDIEALVESYYIRGYIQELLHRPGVSLYSLVMTNDVAALTLVYSIFSRNHEFLAFFIMEYGDIITKHLKECMNSSTTVPASGPPVDPIVANFDHMVLFIMLVERQITQVFGGSEKLRYCLKQEVTLFVKKLSNFTQILGQYLNELILMHPEISRSPLVNNPSHMAFALEYMSFTPVGEKAAQATALAQKNFKTDNNVGMSDFLTQSNAELKPAASALTAMSSIAIKNLNLSLWEARCRVVAGICSLHVADGDSLCELYRKTLSDRLLRSTIPHTEASLRYEVEMRNLISIGSGFGKSFVERTNKLFSDTVVSSYLHEKYRVLQSHRSIEYLDTMNGEMNDSPSASHIAQHSSTVQTGYAAPNTTGMASKTTAADEGGPSVVTDSSYWWNTRDVSFKPTVVTSNIWVLTPPVDVKYPADARYLMESYVDMFMQVNKDCKMQWNPSYGYATLDVQIASGTHSLLMTTLQMIIFMLFQEKDEYTLSEICAITSIPLTEIGRQILPFAHPRVGLLRKNPNTKELAVSDTFTFNSNARLPTEVFRLPLLNAAGVKQTAAFGEVERRELTKEEKKHAVNAAVMNATKKKKKVLHDELQEEVQQALLDKFEVDVAAFKRSIEYLIDNEYIERDETNRSLYIYM